MGANKTCSVSFLYEVKTCFSKRELTKRAQSVFCTKLKHVFLNTNMYFLFYTCSECSFSFIILEQQTSVTVSELWGFAPTKFTIRRNPTTCVRKLYDVSLLGHGPSRGVQHNNVPRCLNGSRRNSFSNSPCPLGSGPRQHNETCLIAGRRDPNPHCDSLSKM